VIKHVFIPLCIVTALAATNVCAATKSQTGPNSGTQQSQIQTPPPPPPIDQEVLSNTAELLKQVAALTKEVTSLSTQVNSLTTTLNSLTKQQTGEAATVADMANRLQSFCWASLSAQGQSKWGTGWCWGSTHPGPAYDEQYSPFGSW